LLAEIKAISIPEKKKEKTNEMRINVINSGSILLPFTIGKYKKENDGEHYRPIGVAKSKRHNLMNADDQKHDRKRQQQNIW
jgi:hypothetical protein